MLECEYHSPKVFADFQPSQRKLDCYEIPIIENGIEALKAVNNDLGKDYIYEPRKPLD